MAEFKKLSEVEAVASVSDTASVLIEENGVIKRAPKDEIGGKLPSNIGTGFGFDIVIFNDGENASVIHGDYADIKNKLDNKLPVLCAIVSINENDDFMNQYMEFSKYLHYQFYQDYIAFYDQEVSIEYQLYSDNHIVINAIG